MVVLLDLKENDIYVVNKYTSIQVSLYVLNHVIVYTDTICHMLSTI